MYQVRYQVYFNFHVYSPNKAVTYCPNSYFGPAMPTFIGICGGKHDFAAEATHANEF